MELSKCSICALLLLPLLACCTLLAAAESRVLQQVLEEAKSVDRSALAFPGAEGFGAYSQGGRGGKRLVVTNLKDDGKEGSLRWAIAQKGPRIVEFGVEGTIVLQSKLSVREPQITIDGSKAPGKGITLKDGSFSVEKTHDVIVRHLRVRPGDEVALRKGIWKNQKRKDRPADAMSVTESAYVIIDHCSASWSSDEVLSVTGSDYITVQWCFITEPLANPKLHEGQSHAFGALVSGHHISYLKNLIAFYDMRGPQVTNEAGEGEIEVVNNCVHNYIESGTRISLGADSATFFQLIRNSYSGAQSAGSGDISLIKTKSARKFPASYSLAKVYLSGNQGPRRSNLASDEWSGVTTQFNELQTSSTRSDVPLFKDSSILLMPVEKVCETVLQQGGATLPKRDSIDARIVDQVRQGKGGTIKSQDDVGNGYGEFTPK